MTNYFRRTSSQVTPLFQRENDNRSLSDGNNGYYDDDYEDDDDSSRQPSINRLFGLLGRNKWFTRRLSRFTSASMKESLVYFLDSCNVIHIKMTEPFNIATAFCFFIFIAELLANTWAKTSIISLYPKLKITGYLCSFYWFLDFIAIISFIPDIPWLSGPFALSNIRNSSAHNSYYVRMFYTARIVRFVRIIGIARSYKISSDRQTKKAREEDLHELVRIGAIGYDEVEKQLALYNERHSKLGLILTESITQRVIFIALLMIFIIPFFLTHTVNKVDSFTVNLMQDLNIYDELSSHVNTLAVRTTIDETIRLLSDGYHGNYVIFLDLDPYSSKPIAHEANELYNLPSYMIHYLFQSSYHLPSYFNISSYDHNIVGNTTMYTSSLCIEKEGAFYNSIFTICVSIILIVGSYHLIIGAYTLTIEPIDRMLNLVEAVAKNPLRPYAFESKYNDGMGDYEIQLLQSTITKITSLLRVGFGEAGAGIISTNLTTKQNSTSINPLLPGIRVYAIFGFCDILQFEDINQRLETDVLTFVNTIAEIVHSQVHSWNGQCNKNLGNAFIVVWRIGDEETIMNLLYRNNLNPNIQNGSNNYHPIQHHNSSNKAKDTPKSRQSVQLNNSNDSNNIPFDGTASNTNPSTMRIAGNIMNRSGSTASTSTNRTGIAKLASGVLRGFSTHNGAAALSNNPSSSDNHHHHHNSISSVNHSNPDEYESNHRRKGHVIDLRRVPGVDVLADKALISYLKIIAEINRSKEILKYRYEPRLTLNGSEEFKVRMGFGLHAGWAIEGAVGSLQKVDATYLSPHVNLAARLESASRQYGVPILLSQNFYDILSVYGQEYCRKIDVVTVKGSQTPIAIYTWDTLQDQDFFLEDRKAKRRSSMASLHTIMSNLESVVEENVSSTNVPITGTGTFGRRLSSFVSAGTTTNTPYTAMHAHPAIARKFSLTSASSSSSASTASSHNTGISLSTMTTAQAAMAAAAAAGISMGGHNNSSSNLNISSTGPAAVTSPTQASTSVTSSAKEQVPSSFNLVHPINLTATGGHNNNFPGINTSKFTPLFFTANDDTMDTFNNDYDLLQLRSHIREDFRAMSRDAVNAYIAGDWLLAKTFFERASKMIRTTAPMLKGDGPSITLLEYMATFNYQSPMYWKGYRELTDK